MTQANEPEQHPQSPSANAKDDSRNHASTLRPMSESLSDNDTSEKPVREKLKKTSLASMSGQQGKFPQTVLAAGTDTMNNSVQSVNVTAKGKLPEDETASMDSSRARLGKQRSFENLEATGGGQLEKTEQQSRPCDVVAANNIETDRPHQPTEASSEELSKSRVSNGRYEASEAAASTGILKPDSSPKTATKNDPAQKEETTGSTGQIARSGKPNQIERQQEHNVDQEMKDGTYSPRKKRSRDQFDTEADREQKIVATEEARAQRRSEELDRAEITSVSVHDLAPSQEITSARKSDEAENDKARIESALETEKPTKSTFGSVSTLSPPSIPGSAPSPTKLPHASGGGFSKKQGPTSSAAFAASGFASLSASGTSPFVELATPSADTAVSPFAATSASVSRPPSTSKNSEPMAEPTVIGGFGSFAKSSTSGFADTGISSFSPGEKAKSSVFGGSVFGGGFGGGFSGSGKLTSFAAPTGDAKLGSGEGALKPKVLPQHGGDGGQAQSDSEGDNAEEIGTGDGIDELDDRFQHQDVHTGEDGEVSVFSARASLYAFKGAWKESGKGTFKLNVAAPSLEDPDLSRKTGRFIMRAHQTYRVLLNAPIFKEMKVGDVRGSEPTSKSFTFAAIEGGKPTPYMVKLADVAESQTLYHRVRELQEELS